MNNKVKMDYYEISVLLGILSKEYPIPNLNHNNGYTRTFKRILGKLRILLIQEVKQW